MEINTIVLEYKDKKITLIPTAHVSKDSAEFAARIIDEINPDCICIELDQDRYNSLTDPDKYRETDIIKIIKQKKVTFMLANLILANYQRKMAEKLGSRSGQEMLIGIQKSRELNVPLILADRNIQTTFKRLWGLLSGKDRIKLISSIISSLFDDEEITEEDILKLQQSDMLTEALGEVSREFPVISDVLVTERDRYLAWKIRNAPSNNIVAILGAAHTLGIQKYLYEDYDIQQYDVIPPKKLSSKLMGWIIPLLVLVAILASFSVNGEIGMRQIRTWILFNGSLSALGALIAGGSIPAILVAFIAAPITSLNPLLASGWFAGITEAYVRKPSVDDFTNIPKDIESWKGFWKNRVTRILMIVIAANIGSTLGTFISGLSIFSNIIHSL